MNTDQILRVESLVKTYGRKQALAGVSFGVRTGEVFGFLGPNGAGKSTTLRIVLGLVRPTSGSVALFGDGSRRGLLAARARIGALVESPSFYPHLTGRMNLRVLGMLSGVQRREAADRALHAVRMTEAADDPVRTYSLGMRQRLGVAQALLCDPELILLDEPTNGLDPRGVAEIKDWILRMNRERGITFLISSHQLMEIEEICSRVAILRKGKLLVEGRVDEILAGQKATYRIGVTDPGRALAVLDDGFAAEEATPGALRLTVRKEQVPRVVETLVRAGIGVEEVVPERLTLEKYFLDVTKGEEDDLGR